jgi:hypothetical protein
VTTPAARCDQKVRTERTLRSLTHQSRYCRTMSRARSISSRVL